MNDSIDREGRVIERAATVLVLITVSGYVIDLAFETAGYPLSDWLDFVLGIIIVFVGFAILSYQQTLNLS